MYIVLQPKRMRRVRFCTKATYMTVSAFVCLPNTVVRITHTMLLTEYFLPGHKYYRISYHYKG